MKKYVYFFLLAVVALLTACSSEDKKASGDTLSIYTTVYPLQYFTERIGEEFVNVKSIYPAGANEHSFEPTQKDMMALADADVFFYIGQGLEGFVENAKKTLANEHVKLVATGDAITEEQFHISTGHVHAEDEDDHDHDHDEEHGEHEEHGHHEHDTHVWLSPILSKELALSIKNELVAMLPAQEELFTKNYEELVTELDALHANFEAMATKTTKKTFFVSHAAFGYIAGHYGFNQIPVAGLNSQSEPSQKQLAKIVDLAKQENIQYIFFEQNVSSNLTSVIQKEVGAEALTLHNLSVLTKDDVKNNETYFTLMQHNIEQLAKALH
ncbi:zinc ABC transporter substrate-binding protein [Metasolibacillus meyeri]|uniref:Zinc ABC transporter substrate-binding protein n=1 Tax=Metasolibacillus meyeri TaxID=1071052 RepID=A0AAW9NXP3_9BACL|nr:zinc ABC transporter substrate-binding protein [Metasolibacillus meyeri]MEC1180301.1 zinc ABC transporter substrate-binding protein [Metasolibacillus meyeri]